MNYPFPSNSPYMQAAMAQAVQAMMSGGPLPPNCLVMSMPFQQAPHIYPQSDQLVYPQQGSFYGPQPSSAYTNASPLRALAAYTPPNYNYPIVPQQKNRSKSKKKSRQQPHSNIYNSSSFDTYMHDLSWSRLFGHHSRKSSKQSGQTGASNTRQQDEKSNASKKQRASSSDSSTSSTTSDETIRRVNVVNQQKSSTPSKQPPKGSLPFKYSSEFVPGLGKQQPPKTKSQEKKP